jgi:hypothetical protein
MTRTRALKFYKFNICPTRILKHLPLFSASYSSVVQQPKSGPGCLIADVPRSHTIRHTLGKTVWTSDQLVAEAATYTTCKKQTSIPSAGFEPAIPAVRRLQTYASDCTAARIGLGTVLSVLVAVHC